MGRFRSFKECQAGSAAVEFAIVIVVFVAAALGIVEFGRGLNIRNQLALAADKGARLILMNKSISDAALETSVRAALITGPGNLLTVTIGTETVGGASFRTITLVYPFVPSLAGIFDGTINLTVSRRTPIV